MIFPGIAEFRASGFQPRVVIVGSGPAGISIARILGKANIPTVVLEAGSEDVTEESQDFYKGTTVGDYYFDLDVTRIRLLGGCSNHWAGWCRVLDAHDFEARDWIPHSGWPIRRADLEPFFDAVRDELDLVPFLPDRPITDDVRWVQLIKSPAVRVGEKYRGEIEASSNVALVLNTYVTDLVGDGRRVTSANLWSNGSQAGSIEADWFVASVGGLENSRLLLWSNEKSNGGVVPHAEALGRYWMEHPQFEGGNCILTGHEEFPTDMVNEAFFSPSPDAMRAGGIMNFGVRLIETPYPGVKKLIADLACTAPDLAEWIAIKAGLNLRCAAQIYVGWEQSPDPENRIVLSSAERDAAGIPRLELHWKKGELEHKTLLEGLRLFGKAMAERDFGRVRIADWILQNQPYPTDQEIAGHHHMGGTRMGTDPAVSVVDADCKVHGMENLFVGGSSVFVTSGHCNPTTTIVALAIRLGHHLAGIAA